MRGKRAAFLDHFSVNCNVVAAAAAAGVSTDLIYHWRRAEPAFAAQWAEALALGYQMIEARLVAHVLAGQQTELLEGEPAATGPVLEPLLIEQAFRVLGLRKNGPPPVLSAIRKPVHHDDIDRRLTVKLEALARRNRREAAAAAAAAQGIGPDAPAS